MKSVQNLRQHVHHLLCLFDAAELLDYRFRLDELRDIESSTIAGGRGAPDLSSLLLAPVGEDRADVLWRDLGALA